MQDKREKSVPTSKIIAISIVLLILVGAILFILGNGKTTVTGAHPANIKTYSIVCTKSSILYPYTAKADTPKEQGSTIRIVGVYGETKKIEKIALDYTVYYLNNADAINAESHVHAAFWARLAEDDFEHTLFDNQFSVIDKKVTLSFVAPVNEMTEKSYGYALLSANPNGDLSLEEFEKNYESNGYKCENTN